MAPGLPGVFGDKKIKMRPLMILIAAIALGLIFLGVVLTIVGHWPGYTSWGSNPLKYLGPALLGITYYIIKFNCKQIYSTHWRI